MQPDQQIRSPFPQRERVLDEYTNYFRVSKGSPIRNRNRNYEKKIAVAWHTAFSLKDLVRDPAFITLKDQTPGLMASIPQIRYNQDTETFSILKPPLVNNRIPAATTISLAAPVKLANAKIRRLAII